MNPRILNKVMDVNYDRRKAVVEHVETMLGGSFKGKTIGLLGLAFKPNTDDMRDAPVHRYCPCVDRQPARSVRGYDPVAMEVAAPFCPPWKFR